MERVKILTNGGRNPMVWPTCGGRQENLAADSSGGVAKHQTQAVHYPPAGSAPGAGGRII